MTRPSAIAAVAGALGAALLVAFFKGSVLGILVGAMLSPLPLAMATLGLGLNYLPVAVVGGAVTVTVLTGSFALAVVYLLVDAVPVAVLSRLGMSTTAGPNISAPGTEVGRSVCWLALGAAICVSAALMLMPSGPDGIEAALRGWLDQLLSTAPALLAPGPGGIDLAAARTEFARAAASLLPGATAWNWALRALLSAALGQFLLRRMGLAVWTTPSYRGFDIPTWFFALFAVLAGAALALNGDAAFIASNVALALALPPLLQGLAVVHCALARMAHSTLSLAAFYVVALAVPIVALLALVSLSVLDHFLSIRARFLTAHPGGE